MKKLALILAALMLIALVGCSSGTPSSAGTPEPSSTPEQSVQPQPSEGPEPSESPADDRIAYFVQESWDKLMQTNFRPGVTNVARLEYVYSGQSVNRSFYYYIPSTWEEGTELPLMFSLHGSGSNASVQLFWGNWAALAEREGFIVVVPEAVGVHADGTLSASGKSLAQMGLPALAVKNIRFHAAEEDPCGEYGVDDVQYLTDLIDLFAEKGFADRSRVYCCGFSHGGFMSLRLAIEASDRFAGVAAVSGLLLKELDHLIPENDCKVVFIQGDSDPHVPQEGMHYDNDRDGVKEYTWALSLEDSINYFLGHYGIPNQPTSSTLPDRVNDGTLIRRYEYAGEDGAAPVVAYIVEGGGHTWPGGTEYVGSGPVSKDAQAAELIWAELKDAVRE